MSPSKRDQRITDILTMAKQALDTAQGPLSLAPVPGLSSTALVLSALIDVILVAQGNKGTREDIANHIQALTLIIEETRKKAESALGTDEEMTRTRLVNSPELKDRVATLEKDLKDLTNEMISLEVGCLGILFSKKNSDTLSKIKTGIDDATKKFQIQGGITIELLINGIVNDIEQIKCIQQHELDERALKDLPHVNARYSSALNPTKTGTLQGTRTELLDKLTTWCLRSDTDDNASFIYVLSGGAGTGKSTIAFEMAHRLEIAGALGASFFFVRDAGDLNTTTYVLTTIAYQLARSHTSLYSHIAKAAREYTSKGKQGEKLQMDLDDLLIKPLVNVEASHRPIILIFDALDECTKAAQEEVIRLLFLFMERLPEIPFPVRILVTTRPEMNIEAVLNTEKLRKVSKPYNLHEIPRQIVDRDIELFLDAKLKDLSCWETISSTHPGIITGLTNLSAGLFIYADTVVKLLGNNPYHAADILDALLSGNTSNTSFTLKNLDQLYIIVLQNALNDDAFDIPDVKKYIQIVLGSLALLQDRVSTSNLNDLIGVPMRFIRDIMGRLGSVILRPENDAVEIRMLHASFPQFLIDVQRCTNLKFYIDPSVHHHRLAWICLEVMNSRYPLKRNICELDEPTIMKSDIPGLYDTVKKYIRPSLWYSCVHWATHLSHCNNPSQDILNAVMEFVRTKLLVWAEVLSYMNRLDVAVPALLAALSWCEAHIQDGDRDEIVQLIDDMHRLVLQCYAPINDCPEHLYVSAFRLAPSCSFNTYYYNSVNQPTHNNASIKSMMPRDAGWDACLYTIPLNVDDCRAVLSPNGRFVASGSRNGEVGIWDADIGLSKRTLTGHTESVECVVWAPDGELIASGSADGTIRVWNATSGAQVHIQHVQTTECEVNAIAWSHDGTHLVTSVYSGGVQVWDIIVGKELKRSMTIPRVKALLAISKDLGLAVDWTDAWILRIWDLGYDYGKILKELPVQFIVYAAVFLHNDTQVAFCGENDQIYVWNLESGECTSKVKLESKVMQHGKAQFYGFALSQNENILASSTIDKIHFFSTKSWESLGSFKGYFSHTGSFSPDNRRLLTSYNTIDMWDSSSVLASKPRITSSPSSPIVKHESLIHFVAISLDGSRVAAVSVDAVSIWSFQSASLLCIIRGNFPGNAVFSPDAQKITIREYDKTCIWDISTTRPALVQSISTADSDKNTIAWSPNGQWIAGPAYGPDNAQGLGVFDAVTGELVKYLAPSNSESLWELEFSQDNTMLYVWYDPDEAIFRWQEGEKVDLEQHRWETERDQRSRFHKDAWIIRERDGKRLCWVQEGYQDSIVRWGNCYAVGKNSGQLDILYIEESSIDTPQDS